MAFAKAYGQIRKLIQPGETGSPLGLLVSGLPPWSSAALPKSPGVLGPYLWNGPVSLLEGVGLKLSKLGFCDRFKKCPIQGITSSSSLWPLRLHQAPAQLPGLPCHPYLYLVVIACYMSLTLIGMSHHLEGTNWSRQFLLRTLWRLPIASQLFEDQILSLTSDPCMGLHGPPLLCDLTRPFPSVPATFGSFMLPTTGPWHMPFSLTGCPSFPSSHNHAHSPFRFQHKLHFSRD